jgi:beta-glucosidase
LSYAYFDISEIKLSLKTRFTDKMEVTVTVKNTAKVAGKEVIVPSATRH